MIIRVHAGTRTLIRSLGKSCGAMPGVSIAFDGMSRKEKKIKNHEQRRTVPICRWTVLLSHFWRVNVVTGGNAGPIIWADTPTRSLFRKEGHGFLDRIPGTFSGTGVSILRANCPWCDFALIEDPRDLVMPIGEETVRVEKGILKPPRTALRWYIWFCMCQDVSDTVWHQIFIIVWGTALHNGHDHAHFFERFYVVRGKRRRQSDRSFLTGRRSGHLDLSRGLMLAPSKGCLSF